MSGCVFVMVFDFSQANKTKAYTFVDFIISLKFGIHSLSIFSGWFVVINYFFGLCCVLMMHVHDLQAFFGFLIYRNTNFLWMSMFGIVQICISGFTSLDLCSFYHYLIVSYTQISCLLILHLHHLLWILFWISIWLHYCLKSHLYLLKFFFLCSCSCPLCIFCHMFRIN